MDEREKRDVREWSQTSDTRRRRPENNARKPVNRSGQSRQRMSEAGPGRNRRPARQDRDKVHKASKDVPERYNAIYGLPG